MKNILTGSKYNAARRLALGTALFGILVAAPLLSAAHAPTTNITVTNNSRGEIRHLYLSPPNQDNWGSDQLNASVVASGGSFTLSNVSCDQAIKVIAEDQNGCFLYQTVACGADVTWTITNDMTPDCGN